MTSTHAHPPCPATWADELRQILDASLLHCEPKPRASNALTWSAITYSLFDAPRPVSNRAVGQDYGVSGERVRQISTAVHGALIRMAPEMPILDSVFAAAAELAPCSVADANRQLADLLGPGIGIRSAIEFARWINHPCAVSVEVGRENRSGVDMLMCSTRKKGWADDAIAIVLSECSVVGCTTFDRVAGRLALEKHVLVDQVALRRVLSCVDGYRELGSGGWVTVEVGMCGVAQRAEKILSLSDGPLRCDTLAEALAKDVRWLDRAPVESLSLPPLHILPLLIAGWNWVEIDKHNRVSARARIDPDTVLSEGERAALKVLQHYGGCATRTDLGEVLRDGLGMSDMTVSNLVASSVVFTRLSRSIYGIRGQKLDPTSLKNAQDRWQQELDRAAKARNCGRPKKAVAGALA